MKKFVEDKGFILHENNYINNQTKLLVEKDGYFGLITFSSIQRGKSFSITHKSNPYSIQNIQHYLDICGDGATILSTEYKNNIEKLKFQCSCGNIYYRNASDLFMTVYNKCPECTINTRKIKRKLKEEEVIKEFEKVGYKILKMDYQNNETKILCQNSDGYIGAISVHSLRAKNKLNPFNYEKYSKEINVHNLNVWLKLHDRKLIAVDFLGKINGYTSNVFACVCPKCGQEFNIATATIHFGKDCCFDCANTYSQYSIKIEKWLKEHNIDFIREKRFIDCIDKAPLPFDFYIESKNLCIEVDGEGHFRPVNFKGINDDLAKEHYEKTIEHDIIKNNYCIDNGIDLLRLSYIDIKSNKYKEILANKFGN